MEEARAAHDALASCSGSLAASRRAAAFGAGLRRRHQRVPAAPSIDLSQARRPGEGVVNHTQLGRLRRGRVHVPGIRLGDGLRAGDRLRRPSARPSARRTRWYADDARTRSSSMSSPRRATPQAADRGWLRPAREHRPRTQLYRHHPGAQGQAVDTFDGVHYGIPHGRGANLLMCATDIVNPAPANWAACSTPSQPFAGKVSVYDAPIYIADAAVVLMKTQPDLGITNRTHSIRSNSTPRRAAQEATPLISQFWADYTKQIEAFAQGDAMVGTTWQINANLLSAGTPPTKVETVKPEEGSTGWADTWMIDSKTQHPNCAYLCINHIVSPLARREDRRLLRRGARKRQVVRADADGVHADPFGDHHHGRPLCPVPCRRGRLLEGRLLLDDAQRRRASTAGPT